MSSNYSAPTNCVRPIIRTLVCALLATELNAVSSLAQEPTPLPIIYPARTTYQYTLPYDAMTTAGVYGTDNKLIRVLWSKFARRAGTHNGVWDGTDEYSQALPPGVYTIKLIAHNVEYVWDGLVGNTSTSIHGPSHHAAQGFIQSMAVDGTNAFYALGEQEGFPPVRRFNTGSPQTATSVIGPDARVNFDHVATDGVRIYYANRGSAFSFGHPAFVAASNVSDNLPASFTAGVPISANPGEPVYPSCIDIWPGPHPNGDNPTGLAVQKNGNVLAVSHGGQNLIRLFHKTSGDPIGVGTFFVPNPQELAMTSAGDLWVMTGTTIRRYTNLTGTSAHSVTITGLSAPAAIATDGETLIVADAGTEQKLKAYNANGASVWTFPSVGGGYATRGPDVTNDKFQFQVGARATPILRAGLAAAAGSIWVSDGATDRLLRLNASNRSYIDQIMFLTQNLGAVADPKTPTRLIGNGWLEFQIDYTKPLRNGGWTLRKNWAAGVPNNFFGGLDEGMQEVTTLSNGRVYGTITDYSSSPKKKTVVELPATGNLRICKDLLGNNLVLANEPTASAYGYGLEVSQPPSLESDGSQRFHRIANGRVTWYQRDLVAFDPAGNPAWAPERILASAPYVNEDPVVFNELALRQGRHPITSSNVLVTFDDTFQTSGPVRKVTFPSFGSSIDPNSWKHLGGIGVGQVDWGWKQSGTAVTCTNGMQSVVCSYSKAFGVIGRYDSGDFNIGDGVQYAGSLVMAQGRNVVYGYPGEFWRQTEASQWMHFYDNGLFIGQFGTPGTFRNRYGEALPGFTGNCFYPTMVGVNGNTQATTGDTYLWADDKSLHSGVARWHLVGANTVQEFSGSGQTQVVLTALPAAFPTGLSAVPGHQQVSLTWQPATPANGYDIKISTTNGGPYTTVASTTATSHTVTGLPNGVKHYFVVAATGSAINSNQAAAFPFNQVGIAGRFKGGPSDPWYLGKPMVNLPAVLGDLTRTEVGRLGSVLYNWWDGGAGAIGSSPVPFTIESRLDPGISVDVVPGPWINDPQFVKNQFFAWKNLPNGPVIWKEGHDAAIDLPNNSTGSVNINVSDNTLHYVTVVSPPYFARRRDFTISIAPQGQPSSAASYTVNDPVDQGDNHVFQFVFRGNVTLSFANRSDTGACLQGLFFD